MNAFHGLIIWLDIAEERISELEGYSSRNFITKEKKDWEKKE